MFSRSTVAALALLVAVPAQAETIRVGMSGGYFPFTFVQQDVLQGFEVDVARAIAEQTGDDVEFVTMSFSGLVGALEARRIDTIANQITITPEREAKYTFTQPYVFDGAQVVVKAGNEEITGVEDLKGKSVAVDLGSNYEDLMRELPYADEIDIRTYEAMWLRILHLAALMHLSWTCECFSADQRNSIAAGAGWFSILRDP